MTVFTKFATLVRTTLLYLRSWLLYPFVRLSTRKAVLVSIGRASDDAEKQQSAPAIGEDSQHAGNGRGPEDLEKGVFCLDISPVLVAAQTSSDEIIAIRATPTPKLKSSTGKSHDHKVAPLSKVTNSAPLRTPPRPPSSKNPHHKPESKSKSDSENVSPARASPQPPCKPPSPLRRMPRYLNLTGAAPAPALVKSSNIKESPAKSRHSPGSSTHSHTHSHSDPPPAIIPLQLESASTPPIAIDLAARIQSVFYGPRADLNDEAEPQVRDFFNRDSGVVPSGFGFALDGHGSLGYIKDLDAPNLNKHEHEHKEAAEEVEEEDDCGRPLGVRSTCCPPSECASSAEPTSSSELPYLRDSTSSLSVSTRSSKSGAFDGLLSCIERKYPGHEWGSAIIQFSRSVLAESGSVQSVEQKEEEWSEVLSLHDYASAGRTLVRNLPRSAQVQVP